MSEQTESTLDLEQPDNRLVNVREWWAERLGWVLIAAVLVGALLGAFGPGPLSQRKADSADGRLEIEFYAVQRYEAPAELRITFKPPDPGDKLIRLALSRPFLDEITPEAIMPPPVTATMEEDRVVYSFLAADLGDEGRVTYRYQHDTFGWSSAQVTLLPGTQVELSQFVCP